MPTVERSSISRAQVGFDAAGWATTSRVVAMRTRMVSGRGDIAVQQGERWLYWEGVSSEQFRGIPEANQAAADVMQRLEHGSFGWYSLETKVRGERLSPAGDEDRDQGLVAMGSSTQSAGFHHISVRADFWEKTLPSRLSLRPAVLAAVGAPSLQNVTIDERWVGGRGTLEGAQTVDHLKGLVQGALATSFVELLDRHRLGAIILDPA